MSLQIRTLSQKTAAELLGVTARSLRAWEDAPRNRDGSYPGPDLVAWFIARRTPDDLEAFDDQRQRLAAAQAEKIERENLLRAGALVDLDIAEREWTHFLANLRTRLLRIPTEAAAAVPPDQRHSVQEITRAAVHDALRELSKSPDA
jgi:hypothetical protein